MNPDRPSDRRGTGLAGPLAVPPGGRRRRRFGGSHINHADLGGRPGFGAVRPEPEGELWHAAFEPRALALTLAMGATGGCSARPAAISSACTMPRSASRRSSAVPQMR